MEDTVHSVAFLRTILRLALSLLWSRLGSLSRLPKLEYVVTLATQLVLTRVERETVMAGTKDTPFGWSTCTSELVVLKSVVLA